MIDDLPEVAGANLYIDWQSGLVDIVSQTESDTVPGGDTDSETETVSIGSDDLLGKVLEALLRYRKVKPSGERRLPSDQTKFVRQHDLVWVSVDSSRIILEKGQRSGGGYTGEPDGGVSYSLQELKEKGFANVLGEICAVPAK